MPRKPTAEEAPVEQPEAAEKAAEFVPLPEAAEPSNVPSQPPAAPPEVTTTVVPEPRPGVTAREVETGFPGIRRLDF